MTKELKEQKHKLFSQFVLRLLERELEWNLDTIDQISDAAMDLRLADMDSEGNFKAIIDSE